MEGGKEEARGGWELGEGGNGGGMEWGREGGSDKAMQGERQWRKRGLR